MGIGGLYTKNGVLQRQGWRPMVKRKWRFPKSGSGGYVSAKGKSLSDDGGLRPGREEIHVGERPVASNTQRWWLVWRGNEEAYDKGRDSMLHSWAVVLY